MCRRKTRIKQSPPKNIVFQRTLFGSSGTNIYYRLVSPLRFTTFPKAGRPLLRITAKNHSRSILLASLPFILSKHSFYPLRQQPGPFLPATSLLMHPSHFRSPPLFIRKDSSVRLCFRQVRGTDVYGRKSSFLRKRISVHKLA